MDEPEFPFPSSLYPINVVDSLFYSISVFPVSLKFQGMTTAALDYTAKPGILRNFQEDESLTQTLVLPGPCQLCCILMICRPLGSVH